MYKYLLFTLGFGFSVTVATPTPPTPTFITKPFLATVETMLDLFTQAAINLKRAHTSPESSPEEIIAAIAQDPKVAEEVVHLLQQ